MLSSGQQRGCFPSHGRDGGVYPRDHPVGRKGGRDWGGEEGGRESGFKLLLRFLQNCSS